MAAALLRSEHSWLIQEKMLHGQPAPWAQWQLADLPEAGMIPLLYFPALGVSEGITNLKSLISNFWKDFFGECLGRDRFVVFTRA